MPTYYRINSGDEDPEELLEPDNQWTTPWNAEDTPEHCDKCGGELGHCPVCRGTGTPDTKPRRGVSVFADVDELLRYLARRGARMEGSQLVRLEGEKSDDEDFDADEGALLVCPTKIVDCRPLRDDEIAAARDAVRT